jgi:hypothetical protein
MRSWLLSYAVGLLFGAGLLVSGMTRPAKVIGFLDPTGPWDPSLGFVMVGAIGVHALAYRVVARTPRPLWSAAWALPTRRDLDWRLLAGAALFGTGWGLGGYCPGPALTSAVSGSAATLLFTGAMLAGMWAFAAWEAARAPAAAAPVPPKREEERWTSARS